VRADQRVWRSQKILWPPPHLHGPCRLVRITRAMPVEVHLCVQLIKRFSATLRAACSLQLTHGFCTGGGRSAFTRQKHSGGHFDRRCPQLTSGEKIVVAGLPPPLFRPFRMGWKYNSGSKTVQLRDINVFENGHRRTGTTCMPYSTQSLLRAALGSILLLTLSFNVVAQTDRVQRQSRGFGVKISKIDSMRGKSYRGWLTPAL
jgi:hypothetical protein